MMNTSLWTVFKQIGLTGRHAIVYEALILKPSRTPLQLARETKLNRSSLYRYLEELRNKGLVTLILRDKSSYYQASPEGLEKCLVGEETRVEQLRSSIPALLTQLRLTQGSSPESEVKYFQGIEGLKQMLWNVVASGVEYVGLGYEDWNASVGKNYAEKLRAKNMVTGAKSREITNRPDEDFGYTNLGVKYQAIYEHRPISPSILEIKHDTYIYGKVFAYYYHYQGEYFGVEIHNAEIARTERQMFEILWKMALKK